MQTIAYEEALKKLMEMDSSKRMAYLLEIYDAIEEPDMGLVLIGEIWTSCNGVTQYATQLLAGPFSLYEGPQLEMMTKAERDAYEALPEEFTVWRGCYKSNIGGISWSLKKAEAEAYPFRPEFKQNMKPLLIRARARKSDVIAIKLDGDAPEIITYWAKLEDMEIAIDPSGASAWVNSHNAWANVAGGADELSELKLAFLRGQYDDRGEYRH